MGYLPADPRFNPCPRCGKHNVSAMYFDSVASGTRKWGAECNTPACEDISMIGCHYNSPEEAIAAWNQKYPKQNNTFIGRTTQAKLPSDIEMLKKRY